MQEPASIVLKAQARPAHLELPSADEDADKYSYLQNITDQSLSSKSSPNSLAAALAHEESNLMLKNVEGLQSDMKKFLNLLSKIDMTKSLDGENFAVLCENDEAARNAQQQQQDNNQQQVFQDENGSPTLKATGNNKNYGIEETMNEAAPLVQEQDENEQEMAANGARTKKSLSVIYSEEELMSQFSENHTARTVFSTPEEQDLYNANLTLLQQTIRCVEGLPANTPKQKDILLNIKKIRNGLAEQTQRMHDKQFALKKKNQELQSSAEVLLKGLEISKQEISNLVEQQRELVEQYNKVALHLKKAKISERELRQQLREEQTQLKDANEKLHVQQEVNKVQEKQLKEQIQLNKKMNTHVNDLKNSFAKINQILRHIFVQFQTQTQAPSGQSQYQHPQVDAHYPMHTQNRTIEHLINETTKYIDRLMGEEKPQGTNSNSELKGQTAATHYSSGQQQQTSPVPSLQLSSLSQKNIKSPSPVLAVSHSKTYASITKENKMPQHSHYSPSPQTGQRTSLYGTHPLNSSIDNTIISYPLHQQSMSAQQQQQQQQQHQVSQSSVITTSRAQPSHQQQQQQQQQQPNDRRHRRTTSEFYVQMRTLNGSLNSASSKSKSPSSTVKLYTPSKGIAPVLAAGHFSQQGFYKPTAQQLIRTALEKTPPRPGSALSQSQTSDTQDEFYRKYTVQGAHGNMQQTNLQQQQQQQSFFSNGNGATHTQNFKNKGFHQ